MAKSFPLWYSPVGNHGSCIHHLGLDNFFLMNTTMSYSLQACLIKEIGHHNIIWFIIRTDLYLTISYLNFGDYILQSHFPVCPMEFDHHKRWPTKKILFSNLLSSHLHLKRLPCISLTCKLVPVQYWEYEYGLMHIHKDQECSNKLENQLEQEIALICVPGFIAYPCI